MPETIYGEVDEETLETQQGLLEKLCPMLEKDSDFGPVNTGEKFVQSGKFFVSGDETRVPKIDPVGETKAKDLKGHSQGYKLHISAHPSQAFDVAKAVLPIFRQNEKGDNPLCGVYHKVAEFKGYTNDKDEGQRGKFITIYAKNETELKQIAAQVEKALAENGISGPSHGGGLSPGDQELGTSGMVSMRWGQFSGPQRDSVYLDGKFEPDKRSVPCPPSMQVEFNRVTQETNGLMQQARLSVPPPQQSHMVASSSVPDTSTSSAIKSGRQDMELKTPPHEEKLEEKKPKVSEVLKSEAQRQKRHARVFNSNAVNAFIKFNSGDDPGTSGGGTTKIGI